jgi:hypothetical protein
MYLRSKVNIDIKETRNNLLVKNIKKYIKRLQDYKEKNRTMLLCNEACRIRRTL